MTHSTRSPLQIPTAWTCWFVCLTLSQQGKKAVHDLVALRVDVQELRVQFPRLGGHSHVKQALPWCKVCQEVLLQSTITKLDSRFIPNLLPQAKLLRRAVDLCPKTTKQQFGSRRRGTHFFNSKDTRNQASEVPSSFPRGTSTINQKWVLWTLEWIYEGLRNTIHWERNPSMWEKRTILPKLFLAFYFKGWDSECRQKLQEWKPDTVQITEWKCQDHRCLCMTVALLQSAITIPAKCHSRIRPFCDRTLLTSELFPYWPQYHHSRWFTKAESSGSHAAKSLIEAGEGVY